jgi:hypothetical protein
MAQRERVTIRRAANDERSAFWNQIQFDVVVQESHAQRLNVTENPIETGVSVADHCFLEPASLSLIGSVSDCKMMNAAEGYDNLALGRSNFAYERLLDLERDMALNNIQMFEIVTSVRTYRNMVMTDITMTRDVTSAFIGRFTMSFREVITVRTQLTRYEQFRRDKRHTAAPAVNRATQQPPPPTEQQKQVINRSLLSSGTTLGGIGSGGRR